MRILVISDTAERSLWEHFSKDKLDGAELIISCGDLPAEYLEFLVTMSNLPLLYVPGNHDDRYQYRPPQGCQNIDGRITDVGGLRIAGLGGSYRYKDGPYQYTESEMASRIRRLNLGLWKMGGEHRLNLLVTHAPAAGYGDLPDLAHQGFRCFNKFLEKQKPQIMVHGHVHPEYSSRIPRMQEHPCGTRIYNCCGAALLDIEGR